MFVIRDTETGEYMHRLGESHAWFSESLEVACFMEKEEAEALIEDFGLLAEDGETSYRPLAMEEPDVPFRGERLESWRCVAVCGDVVVFKEVLVSESGFVLNIDLLVHQEDNVEDVHILMDDPEDAGSESKELEIDGTIHIVLFSPQETVHKVEQVGGWFKLSSD